MAAAKAFSEQAVYESIGAMMREGFFYSFIPLGLTSIFLLLAYIVMHSH